jgi:hypothetical protein
MVLDVTTKKQGEKLELSIYITNKKKDRTWTPDWLGGLTGTT